MRRIKKGACLLLTVLTAFLLPVTFMVIASAAGDTYIRGDADGNGVVDVRDVTEIQNVLAELKGDPDGRIALRADITDDGLEISDATDIQMYIAEFENIRHIGEKAAYPQPTTEPQTTKRPVPTRDPYELPIIFN